MLAINTKAPEFILEDYSGEKHALSDYLGKKIVLYFYPKDNTPGCTRQACNFTDFKNEFEKYNSVVIGISKDSKKAHKKFMDDHKLNILLLSDESTEVCKAYDVYKEKMNYGKKHMGIVRTTYIIDENGIITHAFEKVNAEKNPEEMLEIIKNN